MEIDHIFICTQVGAPAGELLKEFGLTEGTPSTHPGQGTANRRFFFHNMMLELLWIENYEEVQSSRTKPMRLYERCQLSAAEASPFGVAFRPIDEKEEAAPFAAWDYHPIYLPEFLKIQVAEATPLCEPMYFYLSFGRRQDEVPIDKRQPMEHIVPLKEVTSLRVCTNQEMEISNTAATLNQIPNFIIDKSNEHLLELEFDNGVMGKSKDFRPNLPLIFKW